MREIIFRGKRVDNGEWVKGFYVWDNPETIGVIENDESVNAGWLNEYEVIPETVGQYTGLKDCNGEMIFEGDVVFAGYGEYYQGTHEHSTTIIIDMSNYDALNALCNANVVEVIGNIHDQKGDV